MKKLTLFLVAMLFSALSFADLNPYAYGLSSELSADKTNLTINYSLNADATGVSVVILDGATEIKTITCNDKKTKGSHSVSIPTSDFPTGKSLTWKVVVNGTLVGSPTLQDDLTLKYCLPRGIGVDRSTESPYFGRIYTTDATGGPGFHAEEGKGLYVFDAALNPIKNSTGGYRFTGGITFGTDDISRVVVSDDGRVFLSRYKATDACPILEVNPANLDANFSAVFEDLKGQSIAIDAKGAGDDLKLVMMLKNAEYDYTIAEYNLGTKTTWSGTTASTILKQNDPAFKLDIVTDNAYISYDITDGVWFTQHRSDPKRDATIAHLTKDGVDYHNVNAGLSHNGTSNGGIAISPDGKLLAVVGAGTKKLTIYSVSRDNGDIALTSKYTISTSGSNHTALEWDYAGNLYVANRSAETITFYAMPYSGTVATPCPSKHAIVIPAPAQLNPFAYGLESELSNDEKNLIIKYSLNAKATSVEWVLMDGNNEVKTVDLASLGLEKGDYTTPIPTTDFPQYKQLTWKIEVKGVAVGEPTLYDKENAYHPSSVDIDNNPESKYFGRILCNEGMQKVKGRTKSDGSKYLGTDMGAGIFEFNAAFEYQGGYNGGKTFPINRYGVTGTASANQAYVPRRIRISEDGRIFVTSLNSEGDVLWELNPENLNEWNTVIADGTRSNVYTETRNIIDGNGNFIAGPNVGFDVYGSGDNLKLLMLSSADEGWGYNQSAYKCVEYDLGTNTSWNKVPSRTIFNKLAVYPLQAQVQYDKNGGVWFTQHNSNTNQTTLPGLAHWDANSTTPDVIVKRNNVQNSGFRYNHDFTKVIIAGIEDQIVNSKKATVYSVSEDATGKPVLTKDFEIDMNILGNNINDFAWDYANNIYAVSNSNEYIAVWAMPHSSDDVVATPAASKYAFSIGKYTVTVNTNDVNKGTVTGGGEYGAGAVVTLTATPKEGYELLYWSDRSKENPRTITVDGNEALSAYFIKKNDVEPTFSITKVWENTNVPDVNTNGYQAVGWDGKVYLQASADSKIMVYNGTSAATEYATSGAGYQIAVDEVGNMIVYNGWFGAANPNNILIYAKGSTTGKEVTFTLPNPGRCDFFSASGNIYSEEGGCVYFYCNTTKVVNRLKIKNGAATDADVTTDVVGGSLVDGCTQNHVIKDIFGNLVAHSRLNGIRALNVVTNEVSTFFILPNLKANTLGGCSFELSGKEFWAYNVGPKAYTSEWSLYNVTDGKPVSAETLCTVDKTTTNKNQAANWLNAQVVDEKTAYIYQYCPTVGIAVWKVTRDHIVTATAENGTVEGAGTYKDNATATLTATANDGYVFKNWTKNGVVVSTENPYSFTVTEDVELVANFDGPFCELILNTNDEAKGTVEGAGFYNVGQTVTITATPAAGYKLLYWSDRSTQNPRTITMNKKEALSAYFVKVYDEEPTFAIEKVWENTNVPTATANGYQAVGWDGKIYMQNKTEGNIKVYNNGTDAAVDYAISGTGQQIAVDEAGNLIVFNESFADATPSAILIYQNGSTTGKAVTFTLKDPAACHFFSASGDIYSAEGGYVYFYCSGKKAVNRLKITNGAATAADVTTDVVGGSIYSGNTQNHVMVDIFGNLVTHARSNSVNWINVHTNECKTFTLPSIKLGTLGGCSFELGGKEFWAYNVGTTNYNSEWNLYNMTDGEFLSNETLYAKDKVSKKTYGAANWLNVQVVDEETAYIYQFCPEVAVAVWKVSLINTVVIDDKADNTTALAEYEGQKVTAKVTRAFSNDSYKTLTLPFSMDAPQIQAVFGDAKVYEFTTVVEGNDALHLQFEPTTSIVAGTPYIIDLPDGDYDAKDGFTIENVTINTTLNSVKQGVITMEPVLNGGGRLDEAGQYWLSADNFLYNAGNYPTALLGLRAYFTSSSSMPIRARVVFDENQATSIPVVVAPENNVRKVMKNGQLIIIRGEQKYNVQGQRME